MSTWHSVCAPVGTPKPIVDWLHRGIVALMASADVRDRFIAAGTEPATSAPQQLRERIELEYVRYEKLLAQLGLRTP